MSVIGLTGATLGLFASPGAGADPTSSSGGDLVCALAYAHRICAYATATGITFVDSGDLPGADRLVGTVEDQPLTVGGAVTPVFARTDAAGAAVVSVQVTPGAKYINLADNPVGYDPDGYVQPDRTLTVPGSYSGPSGPDLPVDQTAPAAGPLVAASADGGVYTFGITGFYGSMGGAHLNAPIVAVQTTADGHGYWLAASDGGVFSFGDAVMRGSLGGHPLNQPIVGMARTPDGAGYWLVASDGGVFSFGDARFLGSLGGRHLNQPIVGITASPTGAGYWLVAADGGVFTFGDARFYGSLGSMHLAQPITGVARSSTGNGYWLMASDGGVFAFGDAPFLGSGTAASGGTPGHTVTTRFSAITRLGDGGYATGFGHGIGYAAFEPYEPAPGAQQAFGAMLGSPAAPVVGLSGA